MPDTTINLSLPYILPSQAQKHVTHNEALQRLDATAQMVIKASPSSPPPDAQDGDCYAIASAATGIWAGKDGSVALRQDNAWIYVTPRPGWRAWFAAENRLRVFNNGQWGDIPLSPSGTMQMLGINGTPDETNRLSVSSAASLFNNAGNGHQMKVNKSAPTDTASLLFQSGWSGRAEMGLSGNDDFSIKVSADGGTWQTALSITGNGTVHLPHRPAVRAALNDAVLSPASGTQTGFQQLHVNQGDFSLGSTLSGGTGSRLVVPATGLYLLSLTTKVVSSSGHTVTLYANGTVALAAIKGSSGSTITHSATAIAQLTANDWLALTHTGTAQFEFGLTKTELMAIML